MAHLDWNAIYLTCFAVGLALSVLAFASGFFHLHLGHLKLGHGHGHLKVGTHNAHGHHANGHQEMSPLNGFTAVAFLCWFGGAGFLLNRGPVFTPTLVLLFAVLSGTAGAGLIFWFFARVLMPKEHPLEPADTPIVGVLGRVSAPVPSGGVGEMLYSQGGARRSMPVAADDGVPIDRGAEVVVLRFARGIAFVRRWDEMQQSLLGDPSTTRRSE